MNRDSQQVGAVPASQGRDAVSLNARLQSIGLKAAYASHLATGRRTPSLELALDIQARLGIDPRFWKERPDLAPDLAEAPMASGAVR